MELQTDDKSEAQTSLTNETTKNCNDLIADKTSSGTKRSHDGEEKNCSDEDHSFMDIALKLSELSKDPKTKVGACIVSPDKEILGTGYSRMPAGCGYSDFQWEKNNKMFLNRKMFYVCHAEMIAVLNKNRMDIRNCTIYVTLFPCNECAKLIIQSGIKEVVYLSERNWAQNETKAARKMFDVCNVKYRNIGEPLVIEV